MKIFCTLSDINYIAMGIALYKSLKEHSREEFTIYYLCLDEETEKILLNLNYEEIQPISLSVLEEDKELMEAKKNRSYKEYCKTLTPYFALWIINNKSVQDITYLDSDTFFYQDPEIFYTEIGDEPASVIAQRHKNACSTNIVYFNSSERGLEVLTEWKKAVLNKETPEYAYLDNIKEDIYVADKTFGHGAPWNFRLYVYDKFEKENKIIWGDKEQPFIFNHFSQLKYEIETDQVAPTGGQYMEETLGLFVFNIPAINLMYRNYYVLLKEIHQTILSKPIEAPNIRGPKLNMAIGMGLFEEDYVLKQSLESIYPFASQIMIAEGPTEFWKKCGREASTDKSNDIIDNFPDPENKMNIVHGKFDDRVHRASAYMSFLKKDADYVWNLNPDEVYKPEDVEKIIQVLYDNRYTSVGIKPVTFFGSFDNYILGGEERIDLFLRIFKVYPGSTWKTSWPLEIEHSAQTILADSHLDSDQLYQDHGIKMYRYSHVYPLQVYNNITEKIANSKDQIIDNYFEKVYFPWITGDELDRDMIEQAYRGVHELKPEFRTESMTTRFDGNHPTVIADTMDNLKSTFDDQLKHWLEIKEKMALSEKEFKERFKNG